MALSYLTVQDILWINLQITGKVQHFDYARLEEGTFYQYAYGESSSLLPQAARFITGFAKMRPFDSGNEATGFVSATAFLRLNGRALEISDGNAAEWYIGLPGLDAARAVEDGTRDHDVLHLSVRDAVRAVIESFPQTLAALEPITA